jgi:hypothetical protein
MAYTLVIVNLATAKVPLFGQAAQEVHVVKTKCVGLTVAGFLIMNLTLTRTQATPTGEQEMAGACQTSIEVPETQLTSKNAGACAKINMEMKSLQLNLMAKAATATARAIVSAWLKEKRTRFSR